MLGDFVALAKEALASGKKDVAAVLASAALEDALKRYAKLKGINDVGDAEMKQVISALKSKGLVGGSRTSLLNAMPKLRNFALHANWDKVTEPETSSCSNVMHRQDKLPPSKLLAIAGRDDCEEALCGPFE